MSTETNNEQVALTKPETQLPAPGPSMAVEKASDQQVAPAAAPPADPLEARARAVGELSISGVVKASTLKLTKRENDELTADFPDEAIELGAGGNPTLLYISHAYLRQRLNKVLGLGEAVFIGLKHWAEESMQKTKYGMRKVVRIYYQGQLFVRGVMVGEGLGDAIYYPDNASQTYSDCFEAAKSNAFRRACKHFGVGLQVWLPEWIAGWKQRHPDKLAAAYAKAGIPPTDEDKAIIDAWRAKQKDVVAHPVQPVAEQPAQETPEEKRQRWIKMCLAAAGGQRGLVEEVLELMGKLEPMQGLDNLPLDAVPKTKKEADAILEGIRAQYEAIQTGLGKADRAEPPAETAPPDVSGAPSHGDSEVILEGALAKLLKKPAKNGGMRYSVCVEREPGEQGEWAATFDQQDGALLESLHEGTHIKVRCVHGKYGLTIIKKGITVVQQ